MTKRSRAFDEVMEEARHRDDLSHDEYMSEQYFRNRLKGVTDCDPVDEQQEGINQPKRHNPKNDE